MRDLKPSNGRREMTPFDARKEKRLINKVNRPQRGRPELQVADGEGEIVSVRRNVDPLFFVLVLVLMLFGSVMVFSASYADASARFGDSFYFARRQLIFVALSMIVMPAVAFLPYRFFYNFAFWIYLVTFGLLALVVLFGFAAGGAQRWIEIGGVSLQPSEVAKVSIILALARYFSDNKEKVLRYRRNRSLKGSENRFLRKENSRVAFGFGILRPLLILAGFLFLIALEKHISGIVIVTSIAVIVMFYSGSRVREILLLIGGGVAGVATLILVFPYAISRVQVWLDPYSYKLTGGWQTIQGLYAIGSGGLFGLGLGNSRLKYSYVSQPHNDFIFTIVCEELGFIGACAVLLLFALLIARGFVIARRAPDSFASIVAFGISSHLALQVLLNIAVVTNSIPNTGISLPFFSYGGSSLLVLAVEMGVMLSISRYSYIRK